MSTEPQKCVPCECSCHDEEYRCLDCCSGPRGGLSVQEIVAIGLCINAAQHSGKPELKSNAEIALEAWRRIPRSG